MAKKKNTEEIINTLGEEDKVATMVPIDPLNPDEGFFVGINGCLYSIPRGKMIQVPKSIALIISESLNGTVEAQNKIKVLVDGQEA